MPELPEVESVRLGLTSFVEGRSIDAVHVLSPRAVRDQPGGIPEFRIALLGRVIATPRRRGKYLWLPVHEDPRADDALLIHLGMSGQLRVSDPGDPIHPHTRVRLLLDSGREVRFVDQRQFGRMCVTPLVAGVPAPIVHIAPDPFDPVFDRLLVARRMHQRSVALKRQLLDQNLVSGIGNIYADEALWRARLYGGRLGVDTSVRSTARLLDAAREVMSEALTSGGTSFDRLYVHVNGESGYFDRELHAYGREGEPCARCGTPIRRESFMNRSSYFCPRCQAASARSAG